MKNWTRSALAIAGSLATAALMQHWSSQAEDASDPARTFPIAVPAPAVPQVVAASGAEPPPPPEPTPSRPLVIDEPAVDEHQAAAVTMAHAREHGDDRTPPMEASPEGADALLPTPWDLMSPETYRSYERRNEQHVMAAYARAAATQLQQWKAALDDARANGLSEEQIAVAEEKIRRLETALPGTDRTTSEKR